MDLVSGQTAQQRLLVRDEAELAFSKVFRRHQRVPFQSVGTLIGDYDR
jgi:hypothetical protein